MKTTVIARLYNDWASAKGVRERLYRDGFPRHTLSLISPENGSDAAVLTDLIERALVPAEAAKAYASRVADGASLVVVRATYKPLNAARIARETFASSGAISSGLAEEEFKVDTPPDPSPSILKDHPRFLTMAPDSYESAGPVSEQLGLRLLSPPKRRDSVMSGGKQFFGDGIIRKQRSNSAMRDGGHISTKFWPQALLSRKPRKLSVIPGGGHPFSRLMGWSTTI